MDFPLDEYERRLARVRAEMARHDLPVLLLHQPENMCYLSGFRLSSGYFAYHALLVPRDGPLVLVVREMEEPAAVETSWVAERSVYGETEEPVLAVQRALRSLGLEGGRIGVEEHSWYLTLERQRALRQALPRATFVPEPRIVDTLRLIKSPLEIDALRAAARVVEAAMRAGIDAIAPGVSERALAAAVMAERILAGTDGAPLTGVITSGPRTRLLHGFWSERRVEPGDTVYLELSGIVRMYWVRLMRTAVVGTPTGDQQRAAEVILRAQEEAFPLMRPGVPAREVDAVLRTPVLRAGLRQTYPNRVGYSIGLGYLPTGGEFIREFTPEADWMLEPGMVFHVLLMARGIGFSETVVITRDGAELLTRFPRRLVSR